MAAKSKTKSSSAIQPRLRILHKGDVAIGPGKAELLELVRETGSISEAAKRMEMSYMRAWTLIRTMNGCFRQPLVIAARGGSRGGGGAKLTETGREILSLYHQMNGNCLEAAQPDWKQLQKLLAR
jgi:molybdate transport system regulatory protein